MPTLAALYRKTTYSPNQHRANDTAIMDETVARLEPDGWTVIRVPEDAVERAAVPVADLYLNMCQGSRASRTLLEFERAGATLINRPSAVLGCHRDALVATLAESDLAFPATEIHDLQLPGAIERIAASPLLMRAGRDPRSTAKTVWIKRGDVHAERTEDVVATSADDVRATAEAFAGRGIQRVALQAHVVGQVLKFYALANGRFFRYYDAASGPMGPRPAVDEDRLGSLVFRAAALLGLDVFGGDVVVTAEHEPVLIDLNDWPSFAPYRDEAAAAIGNYVRNYQTSGRPAHHFAPTRAIEII